MLSLLAPPAHASAVGIPDSDSATLLAILLESLKQSASAGQLLTSVQSSLESAQNTLAVLRSASDTVNEFRYLSENPDEISMRRKLRSERPSQRSRASSARRTRSARRSLKGQTAKLNPYALQELLNNIGRTQGSYYDTVIALDEGIYGVSDPLMICSAAKNYESVTVVVDPGDYDAVLENMSDNNGETTLKLRERLAIKAFIRTAEYDRAIGNFLNREQTTDASFSLSLPLVTRLRYGENPHQTAALYGDFDKHFEKLHGKELSFNNILDISAATELIAEFEEPTVAILKHTNPCGVGSDADLRKAWTKAFATDKQAPFGGIIVCNRPVDRSAGEDDQRDFQRGHYRARFRARSAQRLAEEKEPAPDSIGDTSNRCETCS